MHASPLHLPRRLSWARLRSRPAAAALAAAAAVVLAGGAAVGTLAATAQAASDAALSANWYESAPYYSTLDSSAPDLGTVMAATGQKAFDMAFILADGSSCCAGLGRDGPGLLRHPGSQRDQRGPLRRR